MTTAAQMKQWKWISLGVNCMMKLASRSFGLQPLERLPFDFCVSRMSKNVGAAIRAEFAGLEAANIECEGIHPQIKWLTVKITTKTGAYN